MVNNIDDVNNITETAESKAAADALDRARLARERREADQRKRLDELRAHAAAAQAQREKREEDRRRRQAEQRARDDDRRIQVEERKRAIWEASISRREALLQREKDRTERIERTRAARSTPRPAFAFGSSTPRLLEPPDNVGFFWAARRAASTSNVMFASAPLTRRASALHLDGSDTDNKDEPDRSPQPAAWSSVARRRTDLVPTMPAARAPGRAHSMTRLDKIPAHRPSLRSASPSMHHLNRSQCRSGETTPGSRPASALSHAAAGAGPGPVVRRAASAPRKPRPASIAGTGVNTPRGGLSASGEPVGGSAASTPGVSRDGSALGGDAPRRPATTPRRPRPASLHAAQRTLPMQLAPGEGKPPVHRKPKPSKDHDKGAQGARGKSQSASPGRALSPSPRPSNEPSVEKDTPQKAPAGAVGAVGEAADVGVGAAVGVGAESASPVSAAAVSQKLAALQLHNGDAPAHDKTNENKENIEINQQTKHEHNVMIVEETKPLGQTEEAPKPIEKSETEAQKPAENVETVQEKRLEEKREEKKELPQERMEENEMTASMSRRITTEQQAKAALAERRRRAREELERQAELERQRLQREAEEEAERQRVEEERQRREEEEARELAQLQRRTEEEKLRRAIEAREQQERSEAARRVREEEERLARLRDEEEKRRGAEEAERARRREAEREERERLARKQRVEAIMQRTRLKKAEEEKKNQELKQAEPAPSPAAAPAPAPAPAAPADNGNPVAEGDLLGLATSQAQEPAPAASAAPAAPAPAPAAPDNGNVGADLLGLALSDAHHSEDTTGEPAPLPAGAAAQQTNNTNANANAPTPAANNGNLRADSPNVGHISASFIQTERGSLAAERPPAKMADAGALLDDDFSAHNGHGALAHPLTLRNAI